MYNINRWTSNWTYVQIILAALHSIINTTADYICAVHFDANKTRHLLVQLYILLASNISKQLMSTMPEGNKHGLQICITFHFYVDNIITMVCQHTKVILKISTKKENINLKTVFHQLTSSSESESESDSSELLLAALALGAGLAVLAGTTISCDNSEQDPM